MRRYFLQSSVYYSLIFVATFILDRVTKWLALVYTADRVTVCKYLSFDLVFNRGVSTGWLHSSDNRIFIAVSIGITLLAIVLGIYMIIRFLNNNNVWGEMLVLSGALSNILDRVLYHGVIDFIHVSFGSWSWPIFNIADVAIVMGVGIMFVVAYKKS